MQVMASARMGPRPGAEGGASPPDAGRAGARGPVGPSFSAPLRLAPAHRLGDEVLRRDADTQLLAGMRTAGEKDYLGLNEPREAPPACPPRAVSAQHLAQHPRFPELLGAQALFRFLLSTPQTDMTSFRSALEEKALGVELGLGVPKKHVDPPALARLRTLVDHHLQQYGNEDPDAVPSELFEDMQEHGEYVAEIVRAALAVRSPVSEAPPLSATTDAFVQETLEWFRGITDELTRLRREELDAASQAAMDIPASLDVFRHLTEEAYSSSGTSSPTRSDMAERRAALLRNGGRADYRATRGEKRTRDDGDDSPPPSPRPHRPMANEEVPSGNPGGKKRALRFNKETTEVLKAWFQRHENSATGPYPTTAQKKELANETGLSPHQVHNWFTNYRKRHWAGARGPSKRARHLLDVYPPPGIPHYLRNHPNTRGPPRMAEPPAFLPQPSHPQPSLFRGGEQFGTPPQSIAPGITFKSLYGAGAGGLGNMSRTHGQTSLGQSRARNALSMGPSMSQMSPNMSPPPQGFPPQTTLTGGRNLPSTFSPTKAYPGLLSHRRNLDGRPQDSQLSGLNILQAALAQQNGH